jgi:hypothetical protein
MPESPILHPRELAADTVLQAGPEVSLVHSQPLHANDNAHLPGPLGEL